MRLFLRFEGITYEAKGGFIDSVTICDTLADALNTTPPKHTWKQVCLIDNGKPYIIAECTHDSMDTPTDIDWVINPNGTIKLTAQEHVYLLAHRRLGDNP